jgi:large subunit ribosomal protein L6
MSRIGRAPIPVPAGVEVKIDENNHIAVKGPKGELERTLVPQIKVEMSGGVINVTRPNDEKENRSLHGLTRSLVNNMVVGVNEGFSKQLEVSGVGYRAVKEGKRLVLNVGFSHQVFVEEIDGITIEVPSSNQIIISGIDKQKVGQFASDIRKIKPPEPYKGKGIRYSNEVVRRKEGKTGAK